MSETLLSGFDGLTLSELLRKDYSTAHIPFVFVTGDATAANLAKATTTGARAVLTKPCLPEQLWNAIDNALHRSEDLRVRATTAQVVARRHLDRARDALERLGHTRAAISLKKALLRGDTVVRPLLPPALRCPQCGDVLRYVPQPCRRREREAPRTMRLFRPRQCGTYEYRHARGRSDTPPEFFTTRNERMKRFISTRFRSADHAA